MGYFPRRKGHGGRVAGVSYPRPNPSPKQIRHSRQAAWKLAVRPSSKAVEAFLMAKFYRERPGLEEYLDGVTSQLVKRLRAHNGFRAVVDQLRAAGEEGAAAIAEKVLGELDGFAVTPDEATVTFLDTLGSQGRTIGHETVEAFVRGTDLDAFQWKVIQIFRAEEADRASRAIG